MLAVVEMLLCPKLIDIDITAILLAVCAAAEFAVPGLLGLQTDKQLFKRRYQGQGAVTGLRFRPILFNQYALSVHTGFGDGAADTPRSFIS